MIDPTEDELSFLRRLERHGDPLVLHGNLGLLQIDRLVPDYVIHASTSVDTGVFSLTAKGRQLLQALDQVDQDEPNSKGG